ncbi:MAG: hypothetical protein JJU12_02015 [Chlamydiales bacterium]|nr:hypothetical protein [Chlamydiales bacterium]
MKTHILPLLEKIGGIEESLATITRCQRLQLELERIHLVKERHWHKHIHIVIKKLLVKADRESWVRFENLLAARADINSFTSGRSTPLLLSLHTLGSLFTKDMRVEERKRRYREIKEIVKRLLEHGADPNLQGFPSTPLLTLLAFRPIGQVEKALIETLLGMLVRYGADPYLIPKNDCYGSSKSPYELAKQGFFSLSLESFKDC